LADEHEAFEVLLPLISSVLAAVVVLMKCGLLIAASVVVMMMLAWYKIDVLFDLI